MCANVRLDKARNRRGKNKKFGDRERICLHGSLIVSRIAFERRKSARCVFTYCLVSGRSGYNRIFVRRPLSSDHSFIVSDGGAVRGSSREALHCRPAAGRNHRNCFSRRFRGCCASRPGNALPGSQTSQTPQQNCEKKNNRIFFRRIHVGPHFDRSTDVI